MRSTFLFFIAFLFFINSTHGQTAKEKALKLLSSFPNTQNLYLKGNMTLHKNGSFTPIDSVGMEYHKSAAMSYLMLGSIEMFSSSTLIVAVDHEEKAISITRSSSTSLAPDQFIDPADIARDLSNSSLVFEDVPTGDWMGGIKYYSKEDKDAFVFLKYDKSTLTLKEIQVTSPDQEQLEEGTASVDMITLIFRYFEMDTGKRAFPHKSEDFVIPANGRYKGVGKYKNYEILAQ